MSTSYTHEYEYLSELPKEPLILNSYSLVQVLVSMSTLPISPKQDSYPTCTRDTSSFPTALSLPPAAIMYKRHCHVTTAVIVIIPLTGDLLPLPVIIQVYTKKVIVVVDVHQTRDAVVLVRQNGVWFTQPSTEGPVRSGVQYHWGAVLVLVLVQFSLDGFHTGPELMLSVIGLSSLSSSPLHGPRLNLALAECLGPYKYLWVFGTHESILIRIQQQQDSSDDNALDDAPTMKWGNAHQPQPWGGASNSKTGGSCNDDALDKTM
ncbi:hypothetical protein EDB89DRAFT_1903242 [Lactarius sanguifluus]|nr:hypothetical protein EDB89DRAFT_1903242 [Lactarius sanguifluus]